MTRSLLLHRRVPHRAAPPLGLLLALALAATGCGGGGDAGSAGSAPADPTSSAPGGTVASDGTTGVTGAVSFPLPSTTVRPTTTAPPSTTPSTSSPPSTSPASTTTTGDGTTGQRLTGTVTASPTCPVERPDQPCPPRPVAGAHVQVFDQAERLVTSADTDGEGRFSLTLAPGRYVLTTGSGAVLPSCPPLTVDVPAAGAAQADIICDTGIR